MLEHEQFFTLRSLQSRGKVRAPTAERSQGDFTEGYGPQGHKETALRCAATGEGSLEDKEGSCLESPGDITQRGWDARDAVDDITALCDEDGGGGLAVKEFSTALPVNCMRGRRCEGETRPPSSLGQAQYTTVHLARETGDPGAASYEAP